MKWLGSLKILDSDRCSWVLLLFWTREFVALETFGKLSFSKKYGYCISLCPPRVILTWSWRCYCSGLKVVYDTNCLFRLTECFSLGLRAVLGTLWDGRSGMRGRVKPSSAICSFLFLEAAWRYLLSASIIFISISRWLVETVRWL